MAISFDTSFSGQAGEPVAVADGVLRITAPNGGPFTFHGTNSYLVGTDRLAIVDPGPDDDNHLAALLAAVDGRPVEAILVTHTHLDHTGLAAKLKAATGAPFFAQGPHRAARALSAGERHALDAANDHEFRPDRLLGDGEVFDLAAGRFEAIATPGHTMNHMAFAMPETGDLFVGDHVMAWSTSIVAPPDGSMAAYMASLEALLGRSDKRYLPGHGEALKDPLPFVRALRAHRKLRETAILDRVRKGDRTIPEIVGVIYRTTDPRLHGAAGLSVLAHMEDLVARGLVICDGSPEIGSRFEPA